MSANESPPKPKSVPQEATFNASEQQWELGVTNAKGKPEGLWKFWWVTTGHHCCDTVFSKDGTVMSFSRLHPDGTYSMKGMMVNDKLEGLVCYQKSKSETTELALTEALYAKVFAVTCECTKGVAQSWKYYDDQGVRVDLEGRPLMTEKELTSSFGGRAAPDELVRLLEFQNTWGIESFAQGFAIVVDDKSLLETWSREKEFLEALMPFATANGTGSCYTLWNSGATTDLAAMPIVIFGDEGGCHVIAENVRGLLEILGADVEPSVDHGGVAFTKGEGHEPSERIKQFRKWLTSDFAITAARNPGKLVKAAQAKLARPFAEWVAKYVTKGRS